MNDEVLGPLIPDADLPEILVGSIDWQDRQIVLRITPDSDPVEDCIRLAREAVGELSRISEAAKRTASDQLLATYNENWREYQELNDSSEWILFSNPALSPKDFEAHLTLRSFEIVGADSLSLWFDDGDLFSGHSVVVDIHDGLECNQLAASLYG